MPAFALADAVVDVSLSSSAGSAVSSSASQHIQQDAPVVHHSAFAASERESVDHTAATIQPCNAASAAVSQVPIMQLLSAVDSVKWGQVAAWAAGDSAQAAALVEHLGPCLAESIVSEADQDHSLLRLEAQIIRKKLVRFATHVIRSCLASRFTECVTTFQCRPARRLYLDFNFLCISPVCTKQVCVCKSCDESIWSSSSCSMS